jgi:chromosome segregation ATPase
MAALRTSGIVLLSLLACSTASDPRPSNEDWKAKQEANADAKAAAGADDAKIAAVNKVVSMLEDLQAQVLAEGEAEAATYNKFACFCKTTQNDKSEAIKTGKDDKSSLTADINKFTKQRDDLDKKISGLESDIEKAEKAMKAATEKSDGELAVYTTNSNDLKAALASLTEAIKVLKASKSPSLVQLQSIGKTMQQAALMADALGLGGAGVQKAATFFLQQGEVPVEMEDYKFHSSGIVETLEKLLGDFRKEKNSVDADEVKRVQTHDMFIQDRTDFVKAQTLSMNEAKADREQKIEDIGTSSQELTTVSAQLLDDMEYLDELNTACSEKAKTWDQRTKLRANELTAITQATGIVKDTVVAKTASSTIRFAQTGTVLHLADAVANSDSAMMAIEAEAESADSDAPMGFLQKKSVQKHEQPDDGRQMIISLLKGKGQELKSTLLTSLASKIAGDPFAKIKKLIQELIERLLTEAANEANQKGWCDKATADATQKRTYSADEVEGLNAKMAKLEALSAKLGEEIATLGTEIGDLTTAQSTADKERKDEKTENANTVTEAKAGLAAVKMAIDILDKFYKTSAKAEVDLSLAQGPLDDAPDAGFKTGEAYQGAGAESGGIIGMMEVIQSDFERTISETKAAEVQAQKEHDEFTTETSKSLAEKNMAKKEKQSLKDETDNNQSDAESELGSQSKILATSIKELIELKATCVDTGMSYADRVAMREQEIASLKKALCIFGAFAEYGPDGLADAC